MSENLEELDNLTGEVRQELWLDIDDEHRSNGRGETSLYGISTCGKLGREKTYGDQGCVQIFAVLLGEHLVVLPHMLVILVETRLAINVLSDRCRVLRHSLTARKLL